MSAEPLRGDEAKVALNFSIEAGSVIYTRHFREELVNDNLTMGDVLRVCRSGAIRMPPEEDIRTGHWKYRIEGSTTDGRPTDVVFCLRPDAAIFITVFQRGS